MKPQIRTEIRLEAWASRSAGGSWAAACRVGGVDMLPGLCIVAANTLIK